MTQVVRLAELISCPAIFLLRGTEVSALRSGINGELVKVITVAWHAVAPLRDTPVPT